ncbi:MAG TPA: carboxypeptidase regulatory-like domain-containing protein [Bryobacteraceae bacterium]|nr:carboxypeptidase regulatory-like domain-containing protein [Bryobacteraceae bacterium]
MHHRTFLIVLLALVLPAVSGWAASDRGDLQGTVTDPQGALIPGAQVVVRNVETGVETRLTTNSAGFFLASELVPGNYSVRLTAPGFAALETTGLKVIAGGTTTANAEMRVGDAAQSVQVTATPPLVDSSPANFTTMVDQRYIEDLPLQGRDIQTLVQLIPGVVQSGGPSGAVFGFNSQFGGFPDPLHLVGSAISVNGSQGGAAGWYLEGSLNATVGAEAAIVNPSPDAVAEFNLVANGLAAEYGRTSGGVVNVVLKSGTNQLHGSLYEYNRNSFFSATNPFARRDQSGNPFLQPRINYNDPGGTLGGPVYIPKIYNGRNRTFFFVSEDLSILHENENKIMTVPLAGEKNGDFRGDPNFDAVCNPAAGMNRCLYDPWTTTAPDDNGYQHRSYFPTPVIPQGRINKLAQFYLKTLPDPNYVDPLMKDICGNTCNNYVGAVGSGMTTNNVSLKIDHRFSDKQAFFLDWLYNPSHYENFRYPWDGPTAQLYTGIMGAQPFNASNQLAILGLTSSITPTLINEARISFGRQALKDQQNPDSVTGNSEVKKMVQGMNFWLFDPLQSVPTITVDSLTFGPIPYTSSMSMGQQAYTASDNITKVIGKHTLKAGFAFRRNNLFNTSALGYNLGFYTDGTQDPVSGLGGSGLATFLLGWVDQGQPSTAVEAAPWQTNDDYSTFVQDEFRVRRNLTLNFGVRWDVYGWIRERYNNLALVNFNEPNPEVPAYMGRLDYMGTPNHPGRNLYAPNWGDLGPRLGIAWAPANRWVIRAGFGLVYSNSGSAVFGQDNGAFSSSGAYVPVAVPKTDPYYYNLTPSFVLGQPAPSLDIPNLSANRANDAQLLGAGCCYTFLKPPKDAYVETWSLFVQHEFANNLIVSAGYVGSHGLHLAGDEIRSIDNVPTGVLESLRSKINNLYPVDPSLVNAAPSLGCSIDPDTGKGMCSGWTAFLPYPQWYGIQAMMAPDGYNRYHSGQLRVEKRYSNGMNFIVAYTRSKNMVSEGLGALVANTFGPTTGPKGVGRIAWVPGAAGGGSADGWTHTNADDYDNRARYTALAPDDTPNVLNLAGTYELPFGQGKRFLASNGLAQKIFGNWKITQNWNFQSGVPLAFRCPYNGIYSKYCDATGISLSAGRGSETKAQREAQWFNPAALQPTWGLDPTLNFALANGVNPDGSPFDPDSVDSFWRFGNLGLRPPSGRAPAYWNVDASLGKEWRLNETRRVSFRYDLLNALNHQNLGIPNTNFCLPPNSDGSQDLIHQYGCAFGQITNVATDPRAMQFSLRFDF